MIYIKRFFSFIGLVVILIISFVLSLISLITYPIQIMCSYIIYGDEGETPAFFKIGEIITFWYLDNLYVK